MMGGGAIGGPAEGGVRDGGTDGLPPPKITLQQPEGVVGTKGDSGVTGETGTVPPLPPMDGVDSTASRTVPPSHSGSPASGSFVISGMRGAIGTFITFSEGSAG